MPHMTSVEQFHISVCNVCDPALPVFVHAALALVDGLDLVQVVTPLFWPTGGPSTSWAHGLLS